MLNTALFGAYCGSMMGMAYCAVKMKMMDDFEREIREYREFDFENEKLRDEPLKKAIVLAKIKQDPPAEKDGGED